MKSNYILSAKKGLTESKDSSSRTAVTEPLITEAHECFSVTEGTECTAVMTYWL